MLRRANWEDRKAIYELVLWGAIHNKVLKRTRKDITESIDTFYVWQSGQGIAGCVAFDIYKNNKLSEIRSLVVHQDYQGAGIGTKLVKACILEAKRKGVKEILAITDKVDFFQKLSFEHILGNQIPMFIKL